MIEIPERPSLEKLNEKEVSVGHSEGPCFHLGFVSASNDLEEPIKHRVLETRGGYKIVEGGGQVWLEDSSGKTVSGPVKGTGAFIMYGKLKDLTGEGKKENPLQRNSEKHKTEKELEKEAQESLEAKIEGRRK